MKVSGFIALLALLPDEMSNYIVIRLKFCEEDLVAMDKNFTSIFIENFRIFNTLLTFLLSSLSLYKNVWVFTNENNGTQLI